MPNILEPIAAIALGFAAAPWLRRGIHAVAGGASVWSVTGWTCAVFLVLTLHGPREPAAMVVVMTLAVVGIMLGHVDAAQHWLPDVFTLPAYPLVGSTLITAAIATDGADDLLRAAAAGTAGFCGFGILAACGGMGYGDVKLAGLLGMAVGWLGWQQALVSVVIAFTLGAMWSVIGLVRTAGQQRIFPFGPMMMLGALGAATVG